jgi:hypothetical protein
MTQLLIKNKKGLFLTSVLLIAILVFFIDLTIGVVSLLFTSVLVTLESIFGTTNTASVLSSVLQIASGAVGLFSCISLWKLQKKGLYFFLLAVVISLTANYMAWGFINYFLIAIYGVWTLIILLNFKKLS